jgi:arginine decarboxylase
MNNRYFDLIYQTFEFPQEDFHVENNELYFHDIPLMEIIKEYGTPLKLTYLPKISSQIQKAKKLFNMAFQKVDYKGSYTYCYCTKSSHFSFILNEVLKNDAHLETSSAYDIEIVQKLYEAKKITKKTFIISNGFKRQLYIDKLAELINDEFNVIPVLDNKNELIELEKKIHKPCNLGIRIASEEEPSFGFYTSRLGIRYSDILDFYLNRIKINPNFNLKMLHFFINTGIADSTYYWSELHKCLKIYCELKKICPSVDSLNIGGGFPIKNSLGFQYDYEYMVDEIVFQIKSYCKEKNVPEPNIFTEFGTYTVGESGAVLYSILDVKQQNDRELWYMIDSSFMTTLPDSWAINKKFILLAINNWNNEYQQVNLGGLTCDSMDYYNEEAHDNQVFMPKHIPNEKQYIGFFNTGAYQDSIGGVGGIQHCLIPAPKHVIVDKDKNGKFKSWIFRDEQKPDTMLSVLGY